MGLFSERNGYKVRPLQLETMSPALKNRIWNVYSCEVSTDPFAFESHYLEEILDALGDALKRLETKGIKLHKAFQSAMSSLYGYTSDEGGIRHGSIDFSGASSEDAKYMLISCSAFVNYLIEKWEKSC